MKKTVLLFIFILSIEFLYTLDNIIKIQFIRHGTYIITINNQKILVDPMLSDVGVLPPVPLTSNKLKNPLIPLPVDKNILINDIDAVLLTHYHFDHIDKEAENILPRDLLIFCQPGDDVKLKRKGFKNIKTIVKNIEWNGITIKRFPANHGEGILLKFILGKSSSYFLQKVNEKLFITGDAVLDNLLKNSLEETKPILIVANSGSAQFIFGNPITLTYDSLKKINQLLPGSKIIAVHMDAINHCELTKDEIRKLLISDNLTKDIIVPYEGEVLSLEN